MSAAPDANAVLPALVAELDRHATLAIAVSGGVDSMTLAHVARRFSRARVTIYHAAGPAVPVAAGARVEAHAARHGWPLVVIDAGELGDERYRANPVDRCYWCKTNLYARIREATTDPIASGTNRDDLSDYRPGLRAAAERGVVHPYVDAGPGQGRGLRAGAATSGCPTSSGCPRSPACRAASRPASPIDPLDLAFIDGVESRLAASLGREAVVRCRVTHAGVVIELGDARDAAAGAIARAIGARECAASGRAFAGVRPYLRGAAFLTAVPRG